MWANQREIIAAPPKKGNPTVVKYLEKKKGEKRDNSNRRSRAREKEKKRGRLSIWQEVIRTSPKSWRSEAKMLDGEIGGKIRSLPVSRGRAAGNN